MLSKQSTKFLELNILILEDDDGHALLIEKNLKRTGIKDPICRFKEGQEFLNYIYDFSSNQKTTRSLLLILDLNLSGISGYEVLKTLKSNPATQAIPIIVLSTTDDPDEIKNCYEFGCSFYIIKPIEYDLFENAIQKIGTFIEIIQISH